MSALKTLILLPKFSLTKVAKSEFSDLCLQIYQSLALPKCLGISWLVVPWANEAWSSPEFYTELIGEESRLTRSQVNSVAFLREQLCCIKVALGNTTHFSALLWSLCKNDRWYLAFTRPLFLFTWSLFVCFLRSLFMRLCGHFGKEIGNTRYHKNNYVFLERCQYIVVSSI